MEIIDGLTECWILSRECKPDWEALAAIYSLYTAGSTVFAASATFLAVAVALGVPLYSSHKRKIERVDVGIRYGAQCWYLADRVKELDLDLRRSKVIRSDRLPYLSSYDQIRMFSGEFDAISRESLELAKFADRKRSGDLVLLAGQCSDIASSLRRYMHEIPVVEDVEIAMMRLHYKLVIASDTANKLCIAPPPPEWIRLRRASVDGAKGIHSRRKSV